MWQGDRGASLGAEDEEALFAEPWWAEHLGREPGGWWLAALDTATLAVLPSRQRVGFLNAAADLLRHLVSLLPIPRSYQTVHSSALLSVHAFFFDPSMLRSQADCTC